MQKSSQELQSFRLFLSAPGTMAIFNKLKNKLGTSSRIRKGNLYGRCFQRQSKKLSNAKREGLIVNFYEMESGGVYKVFTTGLPLIEETVSNSRLDRWLADLKVQRLRL
ncbi:hypothetical protein [Nostoc sp.]